MTEETRSFLKSLRELHEEIAEQALAPAIDPGRLMRLIALGVNHCMVGIAALIDEPEEPQGETPQQLRFPFAVEDRSRCEKDSTSGP